MANIAVKPVQSAIQADRTTGARTTVSSYGIDRPSLAEAQSRAREWADKAIELHEAGHAEQARDAERRAEIWLSRMLAAEAEMRRAPRPGISTGGLTSRADRETQSPRHTQLPMARRSVTSTHQLMGTNNGTTRGVR